MAQVSVTINGRQFRRACEDGQESHLLHLAQDFDERITDLRSKFGEIGDTRLTVMAALTVADELAEAERRISRLEEEAGALHDARIVASKRTSSTQTAVVSALNGAAERIEALTKKLNQTVGNGGVALG
jgi:cell division protein ZapA